MCGILGGNFQEWDYNRGINSLYHRGPDGSRVLKKEDFSLAFTRLAIMDLSDKGMQPMCSMDQQVFLVFNGEVYGFKSLKQELEKSYKFYSSSDTEVILNAYLKYGDQFIDKIDGMFAIAILDLRERRLKLYRDRAGIKPLYYYLKDGKIAFASELKALLSASPIDKKKWKLDMTALYDFLFYQYIPDPKTMYKDCYKLPPASRLIYDIDSNKIIDESTYWELSVNGTVERKRNEIEISEMLRTLIHESVQEQLVADVPVGTFFSGGIDSSIVTYEASSLTPHIQAFTIGFVEEEYDESKYAVSFAEQCDLNHVVEYFHREDMEMLRSSLAGWYDEPFADTSAFPTYAVSKLARESVKVALTGDGGDELFGGYQRYSIYANRMQKKFFGCDWLSHFTRSNRLDLLVGEDFFHSYLSSKLEEYLPVIFLASANDAETYRKRWNIPKDYDVAWHLKKFYHKDLPPITKLRYLDFKTYLPGDILTKVDRVSMAVSLETRVPLLSRKLMEFAFSLSAEECCSESDLKRCLKQSYQQEFSKTLLNRRKRGFSIPPLYKDARSQYRPISLVILEKYWNELNKYSSY